MRISRALAKCPQDGTLLIASPSGAFAERYEFLEALGAGGMSIIYKARQRALNRIVAIKMMHEHLMNDQTVRRFQQEGQAASSLDHPNIVKVHDFGLTDAGQPYMVMDLVEGKALSQVLDELGDLPITQCLIIFIDICDALIHAHEKGILHRDLKPSNIMLTTTLNRPTLAKLVDFGIAKLMDDEADSPMQKLTQTGELFGSPLYMSPEQCYGRKVDRRSDIYSFGCLMFECLTGTVPIRGDRLVDTITKQMTAKAPLLSEVRPDKQYPARLEDVLDKCLAKNPDARYKNFEEVKAQLISIQQDIDDGLMHEKSALRRALRTASEWKVAGLLFVCSLVILCGIAYGVSTLHLTHIDERRKIILDKARLLPLIQAKNITTPILGECIPENVGLTKLDLSGSSVNDDGMGYVDLETDLKELHLENTKVGDSGLKRLQHLKKLERLYLNQTDVTANGLSALKYFPELKILNLYQTNVVREGLQEMRPLKKLTELNLGKTRIVGPCLDVLSGLPIEKLVLSETPLGASDLQSLHGSSKITELEVARVGMDNSAIQHLVGLPVLYYLIINESAFGDDCAKYLAKMKNLKKLDISDTKFSEKGLSEIASSMNLIELQIRNLKLDWSKIGVLRNLSKLTALDVSYNDLDDTAIEEISKIKTLQYLNISVGGEKKDLSRPTGKSLASLANNLPDLKELRMDGNRKMITKESLAELVKLKKLTYLAMNGIVINDKEGKNLKGLHDMLPKCQIKNDQW